MYFAAADIGGTKLRLSIASKGGVVAESCNPLLLTGDIDTIPNQIIGMADKLCSDIGIASEELNHISVSAAGYLRRESNSIELLGSNICGGIASSRGEIPNSWTSIPLERLLSSRFGTVFIENDCISALLAELSFGSARGCMNVVYCSWSTGVGFGIFADGRILRGKTQNAGNAGHQLLIESSSAQCGCGNFGDVESLCGGVALRRDSGMEPDRLFELAAHESMQAPYLNEIIDNAAKRIGRALFNLVCILDTEVFILDGGVFRPNSERLLPVVRETFYGNSAQLASGARIEASTLGDGRGLLGAFTKFMDDEWRRNWRETAILSRFSC
jgi:glucokinase